MKNKELKRNALTVGIVLLLVQLAFLTSCVKDEPGEISFDGTVSGTVTDAQSGSVLPGVNVELKQGGSTIRSTTTKEQGNYSMQEPVLGEEVFSITATLNGYESKTINEFTLTAGNQTKEADIQLEPLTPNITVEYPGGLSQLSLQGNQLIGSVTIKNDGQGTLEYTDLETPAWMEARNAAGTKTGSINGGGNAATITITVSAKEIANLGLNDGQSVEGKVLIETDQTVSGTKEIDVEYTFEQENQPPSGAIEVTPVKSSYLLRELITFEAIQLDDDNDVPADLEVSWDFDEGEGFTTPTTTKTLTNSWQASGAFNVSMKVFDSDGAESEVETQQIIIAANQVPSGGNFTTDLSASQIFINNEVNFTATNWTDDQVGEVSQLEYAWDFGDGSTTNFSQSNSSVSHAFASATVVTVTLSVRDLDEGVGTASNDFTIRAVEQPAVTTSATGTEDVGSNFAIISGEVTGLGNGSSGLTDHGFVYGLTQNPTVAANEGLVGLGTLDVASTFTSRIDGLTATTTYFVRAFAINESGIAAYGNQVDFNTTIPVAPSPIDVLTFSNITQTTASVEVSLDNPGIGVSISEIGVVLNVGTNPDLSDFVLKELSTNPTVGSNTFSISGMTSGTTYRVRAYLITNDGEVLSSTSILTTN